MISKQEIEEHNTRVMLERASDEWVTIAAAWDAIPQGFCDDSPIDDYYRKPTNPADEYMCRPGSIRYRTQSENKFVSLKNMV